MLHAFLPLDICILICYIMCCHECMINIPNIKCYECIFQFCPHSTLTVVSCHLLPTPTYSSIHSVQEGPQMQLALHTPYQDWGWWWCTRARHWASGVRGVSLSPVLHRVTIDHLTRPQYSFAPSDSDLTCSIQSHHWHTGNSGWWYILRQWSKM